MRRTLPLILAAAFIAGCAPSEDEIAEALARALATTTTTPATISTTTTPATTTTTEHPSVSDPQLVTECRRLHRETADLLDQVDIAKALENTVFDETLRLLDAVRKIVGLDDFESDKTDMTPDNFDEFNDRINEYVAVVDRFESAYLGTHQIRVSVLNTFSVMAARCSNVAFDDSVPQDIRSRWRELLETEARDFRDRAIECSDYLEEAFLPFFKCPPIPSIAELLPEAS